MGTKMVAVLNVVCCMLCVVRCVPCVVCCASCMMCCRSQWQSLVKMLEKDGLLPVVVFSFSKKKCQECAEGLSNMSLTTAKSVLHSLTQS